MAKDFDSWNEKKISINEGTSQFFYEREIWFCHLGANVGFEQDGVGEDFVRPIVVAAKFNNDIFWGIPLTRTDKKSRYYFPFEFCGRKNSAVLSQLRLLDTRRLVRCAGKMNEADFSLMNEKVRALLP